jgi:deoxyribonuclease-4
MARLIGAHMPTSKGLHAAIRNGSEIGCTAVQVFTSSPQQWKAKVITDEMADDFRLAVKETNMRGLISHDSYLVNLAAPDPEIREKSEAALIGEIERCSKLGIPHVVSHMGSHLGQGEEVGLSMISESVANVLAATPKDVSIAMETTAGQGSNLGYKFEHLRSIIDANHGNARLRVCLDTCHIFAAGYDIRDRKSYRKTMLAFDDIIGFDRLACIHANDSKHPLGSRKDRHEHIGDGHIGIEAFRLLVNDPAIAHATIVVETPDAEKMHSRNVGLLFSLVKK